MSWYQYGQSKGQCPRCKGQLRASRPREMPVSDDWWEVVGSALFRMHTCQDCQVELVSVHMLLTPEEMVEKGIWPSYSSSGMP